MSHECDDCGREFDTLTRLRLHDCSSTEISEDTTVDSSDTEDLTPSGETDYRPDTVELAALDEFLQDETDPTPDHWLSL